MKKIIAFLALVMMFAIVGALTACGDNQEAEIPEETQSSQSSTYYKRDSKSSSSSSLVVDTKTESPVSISSETNSTSDSTSTSSSVSESTSDSTSSSSSVSESTSDSTSASPSVSESTSDSTSSSSSVSESTSDSTSTSTSVSDSTSVSTSTSPSVSDSTSDSTSTSPSVSDSTSDSTSTSPSVSDSTSDSTSSSSGGETTPPTPTTATFDFKDYTLGSVSSVSSKYNYRFDTNSTVIGTTGEHSIVLSGSGKLTENYNVIFAGETAKAKGLTRDSTTYPYTINLNITTKSKVTIFYSIATGSQASNLKSAAAGFAFKGTGTAVNGTSRVATIDEVSSGTTNVAVLEQVVNAGTATFDIGVSSSRACVYKIIIEPVA